MKKPSRKTGLSTGLKKSLGLLLCGAAATVASSTTALAVIDLGNPYVPTGATNFKIYALQGLDPSSLKGDAGYAPRVSLNGEFADGIGVLNDTSHGDIANRQSGIGLYTDASGNNQSTGLLVQYNQAVDAASTSFVVEDFDIGVKDTFFKSTKVEPTLTILGPGGSIYATASPTDLFPNLVPSTAGLAKGDTWSVNIGAVLATLGKSNIAITGFILGADMSHGEVPNSDPYFLVSAGNGTPPPPPMIPEVPAAAPLAAVMSLVMGTAYIRRRRAA